MSIRSRVEKITPQKARKLLESNTNNRPLKSAHIARLADDIKNGRWVVNGESIKVDEDDVLQDGQHRLEAIFLSGCTVESIVTRGLPANCFDTIDRGVLRSFGDILHRHNEKNCKVLAAALGWMHRFEKQCMKKKITLTPVEILDTLARHPEIRESFKPARKCHGLIGVGPAMFLHYIGSRVEAELTAGFFELLGTGLGLKASMPVYRYRELLQQNRASTKGRRSTVELLALGVKAWNATYEGKPLKSLKWITTERNGGGGTEEFPELLGWDDVKGK